MLYEENFISRLRWKKKSYEKDWK